MTAAVQFLTADPGPTGAEVMVEVRRGGKPVKARGRIVDGPSPRGLYHVEMMEECDNYLPGDSVPFYRREMEPAT